MTQIRTIEVIPYSEEWQQNFNDEAESLKDIFGTVLCALHHIGSTAVPGIMAKPIIDILGVTSDIDAIDSFNEVMREHGYIPKGEFGIAGRRFFIKGDEINRTHHLHMFAADDDQLKRHLNFRDYLIAHPHAASYYSELKRMLAAKYPNDIESYMDGKNDFIKRILQKSNGLSS